MNTPHLVLGVTGSIAAYKTPELTRQLIKAGFSVAPILSENAHHFVAEAALNVVSMNHLEVAKTASVFVIAPATANIISKCAHGIADDLLTSAFLAFTGPKLIVPAMHTEMYLNPIIQDNIAKLKKYGVHFLGPDTGDLAVGDVGIGRMVDLELIVLKAQSLLLKPLPLAGKRIIVTAGGTRERMDSVRVISNLSTGKLGSMIAHVASFMGAKVDLISTVPVLSNPHLDVVKVESVDDMKTAIEERVGMADALYMAAAVSDFAFETQASKIKRTNLKLDLKPTPDILAGLSKKKKSCRMIGFCLEDQDLEKRAREKLKKKNLDFIVANKPDSIGKDKRDVLILSKNSAKAEQLRGISLIHAAHRLLELTH